MVDEMASAGGEDDSDEAAKAFDALRKSIDRRNSATTAELKTIRKGVEALFDQIEALQAKPDFAADLAQLKQIGVVVAKRLEALEASPALKQGINAFERAGTDLVKTSAQAFDQKAQRFDYAAASFERITRNINDRHNYRRYVAIAGGLGLIVGALLLLFLPRLLPFDADTYVAAAIMGKSRWETGTAIMHATNPDVWKAVTVNAQLGADNAASLIRCRQLAAKAGQVQKCTVKVLPQSGQ
ncbi:DUF6118 family protein [Asticcacaulis benevestitus]|uniref:Uncharacterized protein n=1 Tax=Asticcacaulis benevestitus DSM 16100 = ATCC BAA-896 TaxID=1121022 RepID=V4PNT1_9CAUL|nr:DUF6118 family protein [Asticcacaulis benevestitus]ESQ89941.1 hypothetical protein ABENE_13125 [Asticcacaulis benevestitus DSM 16100 = ATCC BAA-896]